MKTFIIFILISFLSLSVIGQEKDIKPLKLFITAKKKQVCFGGSSDIITKLTNTSNIPIVIDPKQIGYSASFSWFSSSRNGNAGGSHTSIGEVGPEYKPSFIILQPNESYFKNLTFVFDEEVFTETQKYKMQITYGQFSETKFENIDVWGGTVDSNEMNIFIKKCGMGVQ